MTTQIACKEVHTLGLDAMKPGISPTWLRLFHFALVLAPPLFLVSLLARYQIDLPVWDQWPQVDLLGKMFEARLTFADIWLQHNEHRQPFPRLIMLGMAYLSHWNMSWELVFNLLTGTACFALFGHQVLKTLKEGGHPLAIWLFPTLSLLIFSLSQFENWFWGFAINVYLHLFCLLGAVVLLSHPVFGWPRFIAALLLAIFATYSAPTAFFIWPLGVALLLVVHMPRLKTSTMPLVLWLVIGVESLGFYFIDFKTPIHLQRTGFYREPLAYAHFVLNYLGAPVLRGEYSFLAGLAGLFAFGHLALSLVRDKAASLRQIAPYLAIGLFVVAAAMLAGIGRVGGDSLASRYVSISLWFWAAILVLTHLRVVTAEGSRATTLGSAGMLFILAAATLLALDVLGIAWRFQDHPYWLWLGLASLGLAGCLAIARKRSPQAAHPIVLFLALFTSMLITKNSLENGREEAIWYQHHHLESARNEILSSSRAAFSPDTPLKVLSPEFPAQQTRARLEVLERHKLAAYRQP